MGPITDIVCMQLNRVGMNWRNITHSPYIYKQNPIVVNSVHPTMMSRNPAKQQPLPTILCFLQKKTKVAFGPISANMPIKKANYLQKMPHVYQQIQLQLTLPIHRNPRSKNHSTPIKQKMRPIIVNPNPISIEFHFIETKTYFLSLRKTSIFNYNPHF